MKDLIYEHDWWRVKDLNLRRQSRGIYSPLPLAARATRQGYLNEAADVDYPICPIANNRVNS